MHIFYYFLLPNGHFIACFYLDEIFEFQARVQTVSASEGRNARFALVVAPTASLLQTSATAEAKKLQTTHDATER
jgi:hypothetical protein